MPNRAARLIPYAQLAVLASLVLIVVMTAPYSSPRPTPSRASLGTSFRDGTPLIAVIPEQLPASGKSGIDPHEVVAEQAAVQLLAEAPLPTGALLTPKLPAGTPDMSSPEQEPGIVQLVDDHHFWIVPGTPQEIIAWFGAHRMPGSTLGGYGSEGTYDVRQLVFDTFWLPQIGQVLLSRQVVIAVAQDNAGKAVLRIDSQVVWDPTRPPQSMVPQSATRIVVTDTPQQNATQKIGPPYSRSSHDPDVVRHFLTVVNAMPAATSGFTSCPAFSGDLYTLVFRSSAGRTLATVTLNADSCFGIFVKVGAASVSLFDPGEALLHALRAFLPHPHH